MFLDSKERFVDKWRNLTASSYVPGGSEDVRTQPLEPSSVVPLLEYHAAEPSQSSVDRRKPLEWCAMILEVLQSMEDSNGHDVSAVLEFIKERYEVPEHCKRTLTANLRRLVLQGQLEKAGKRYKIKAASSAGEPSNLEKQKEEQKAPIATETLEDAAKYAAYAIAVGENKAHAAEEACKEAERFAKIAEDNMVILKLAEELYEQCLTSPDGIVQLNP